MTHYVAGFLFDEEGERVALVRKNRPKWQAGKLNAVGGHVEAEETAPQAMRREFYEEAGVHIPLWTHFCTLTGEDYVVTFFRARSDRFDEVRTTTDEQIEKHDIDLIDWDETLPNLAWLIPAAHRRVSHSWPLRVQ